MAELFQAPDQVVRCKCTSQYHGTLIKFNDTTKIAIMSCVIFSFLYFCIEISQKLASLSTCNTHAVSLSYIFFLTEISIQSNFYVILICNCSKEVARSLEKILGKCENGHHLSSDKQGSSKFIDLTSSASQQSSSVSQQSSSNEK